MKYCVYLVFALKCLFEKVSVASTGNSVSLQNLIVTIATTVYLEECSSVRIVHGDQNGDYFLENVTERLFKANCPITIESIKAIQNRRNIPTSCNVIFIDSFNPFLDLFEVLSPKTFNLNGYYTIAFTGNNFNHSGDVIELLWSKRIINVVLLTTSDNLTTASTYYPFNTVQCGDTTVVEINPVEVSEFFFNKPNDLKNCPIAIGAPQINPFIMKNSKKEVVGRDIEILKALSQALRFQVDLWFSPEASYYGNIFENGTALGSFLDLLEGRTDILIGDFFFKLIRTKHLDATTTYYNSEITFVVPPGRELESFEKLLQPFSSCVWIVLVAFGLSISAIIFMIKSTLKKAIFQNRSPYFSLISMALGVSIPTFPSKSFARILLMSFIMFCLVIQAVYSGLLFTFLQTDSRLKEVSSINEMFDKDFKFYTIGLVNDIMKHHQAMNDR